MNVDDRLAAVIAGFEFEGTLESCEEIKTGHINTTYRLGFRRADGFTLPVDKILILAADRFLAGRIFRRQNIQNHGFGRSASVNTSACSCGGFRDQQLDDTIVPAFLPCDK